MQTGLCSLLTIPHSHATVATTTRQGVTPELDATDKVLVHFPATICIGWRRHGKGLPSRGREQSSTRETEE